MLNMKQHIITTNQIFIYTLLDTKESLSSVLRVLFFHERATDSKKFTMTNFYNWMMRLH